MDSLEAACLFHEAVDEAVAATISRYMRVRERTFQALDRVSAAAIGSPDLPTLLPRLLQVLQETVPAVDTVSVMLREGDMLRVESAVGLCSRRIAACACASARALPAGGRHPPAGLRPCTTRPWIPACATSRLRKSGLRAVYAVPLLLERSCWVAHMGSRTSHEFSDEDLLLFRTMAARTTSLIARARAHDSASRPRDPGQQSLAQLRARRSSASGGRRSSDHLGVGVALTGRGGTCWRT